MPKPKPRAKLIPVESETTEIPETQTPTTPPTPSASPSSTFIVEGILPKYEIHLFGGPSHAGKTTLLLQMIDAWRQGKDVFGHASYPVPFVYIALGRSAASVHATMKRIGIDPVTFPLVSNVDDGECVNFDQAYALARKLVPEVEVLFIDGIHHICPGKENNLKDVSAFLTELTRKMKAKGLTIIGVGHSSKVKGDERFSNPRERFLGSSAWGTGSSTMIIVERDRPDELTNNKRKVLVMPSNSPDQVLDYSLDSSGMFQPDIGDVSQFEVFCEMLFGPRETGDEVYTKEIMDIGADVGDQGLSSRTTERYIRVLMDSGRLEKSKWGKYRISVLH
jgi:hypothetical protein